MCGTTLSVLTRLFLSSLALVGVLEARSLAQTADEKALEQPIKQTAEFLEAMSATNVDEPYNTLLANSPLARDPDRLKKVVTATKDLFKNAAYGKPRSDEAVERVKAQRIGRDLAIVRYLYKFEQLPVVWHFSYYRTNGRWVVVGVRFDHDYELLAQ
jgi:hypothetical protein